MTPWKPPETPAERVAAAMQAIGAAPGNADPENAPAPDGPQSPWSAPVMAFAGYASTGEPLLWLACRCGWHLGYAAQYDPIALGRIAQRHQDRCKVAQALLAASKPETPRAGTGIRGPASRLNPAPNQDLAEENPVYPTMTPSPHRTIEVSVLIGGTAQPLYRRADGRDFVAGVPGSAYTLSVRNHTSSRIEVITSVDARGVLDDEVADKHASRGLVIPARGSYEFKGWRVSDAQTREFLFGDPSVSVAVQATGSGENIGVVGFAVWRERVREVHAGPVVARAVGAASAAGAGVATASAGSLGTGIGAYQDDRVGRTSFDRANGDPDILVIGYDTEAELIRQGIIRPADPDPFPGRRTGYGKYMAP